MQGRMTGLTLQGRRILTGRMRGDNDGGPRRQGTRVYAYAAVIRALAVSIRALPTRRGTPSMRVRVRVHLYHDTVNDHIACCLRLCPCLCLPMCLCV